MREQIISEFKYACKNYLMTLGIDRLRAYGRVKGVSRPTTKSKEDLIETIVGILSGEIAPIPIATKGAPVKNNYVDPKIDIAIENIYEQVTARHEAASSQLPDSEFQMPKSTPDYNVVAEMEAFKRDFGYTLRVEDPILEGRESPDVLTREVFRGQLETIDNVSMLIALDAKTSKGILVPEELIRRHDLRDGDVISCYAERSKHSLICVDVLTINGIVTDALQRERFEESAACYPFQRVHTNMQTEDASLTAKYFEWLIPFGKGQRGCLFSEPKVGKTTVLQELAACLQSDNTTLLTLLVDQSPENVYAFQQIVPKDQLVYTTYEDDSVRQVFVAEFLLKRAKRFAESGKDVVLLVDSLSALARAYNETDDSLGGRTLAGGLESKTVHFIKKYFGAARCLEKGGSITMLACVSCDTGNPFDDVIASELAAISNLDVRLDVQMAIKHCYPAIDMKKTQVKHSEILLQPAELERQRKLWENIREFEPTQIHTVLSKSKTLEDLLKNL